MGLSRPRMAKLGLQQDWTLPLVVAPPLPGRQPEGFDWGQLRVVPDWMRTLVPPPLQSGGRRDAGPLAPPPPLSWKQRIGKGKENGKGKRKKRKRWNGGYS